MINNFMLFPKCVALTGFVAVTVMGAQTVSISNEVKKTPLMGMPEDNYGAAVAIDGDTAVIGAFGVDNGGSMFEGLAYVLERNGGTWQQVAILSASDAAADDWFGFKVAIQGSTIVIGAPQAGPGDEGQVYIFERPNGGWTDMTETARLRASDGALDDTFGWSVAIDGDSVAVGSRQAGPNARGAAYVFVQPDGGWTNMFETAKLTASDAADEDRMGFSVAIDGNTVVSGAPNVGNSGGMAQDGTGQIYVFERAPAGWANSFETARLTASDAASTDYLGYSVSIDGNVIVSGAMNKGNTGPSVTDGIGAAYVFVQPDAGWANADENAKLVYSDPENTGYFGWSVDVSGETILVGGANRYNSGGGSTDGEGAGYLYFMPEGGWSGNRLEDEELVASDALSDRLLGYSVNLTDDWLVIGAPQAGPGDLEPGSAYFFAFDNDDDGVGNFNDNCPDDGNKLDPGPCGCGVEEVDSDGDGVFDCSDACPDDATNDSDGDGVCDSADVCDGGDDALDADSDGTPDACDDTPMPSGGGTPGPLPTTEECCGGGMPAMMPFMLLGWRGVRRRRKSGR